MVAGIVETPDVAQVVERSRKAAAGDSARLEGISNLLCERRTCTARRLDGNLCPNRALVDEAYCFIHSPATAEARAEARRRGGLHRSGAGRIPRRVTLRSAAEILALLEQVAGELAVLDPGLSKARGLALVAGAALRCLEGGALEARIAALEGRRAS